MLVTRNCNFKKYISSIYIYSITIYYLVLLFTVSGQQSYKALRPLCFTYTYYIEQHMPLNSSTIVHDYHMCPLYFKSFYQGLLLFV